MILLALTLYALLQSSFLPTVRFTVVSIGVLLSDSDVPAQPAEDVEAGPLVTPRVALRSSKKADWTANFIDYLSYSLSNSMAFSPPDAVPLTNRAKILTGLEALGAYILLVLVIARAVSLLG